MQNPVKIPIPAVGFAPPVYICPRRTKEFTLDGNIDKPFWADVPFTDEFTDIEGPHMPAPRFSTRAKLQWDDEYLYIAALLKGTEIWAYQTERDSVIFRDNDFEIFIDPDSDTQQYYEFEMNALNTVWDLLLTKAYRDLGKPVNGFDMHGLRTAVHINGTLNTISEENRDWSVEVVIPFSAITECSPENRAPRAGEYYRLNFSRVQWKTDLIDGRIVKRCREGSDTPLPEDNWVWSPTGVINIHYPELWGFLVFGDASHRSFEIPRTEYVKWQLRLLYYAQHIFYERCGSYSSSVSELGGILREYSPVPVNSSVDPALDCRIETTEHFFEINIKNGDGSISVFADGKTVIY